MMVCKKKKRATKQKHLFEVWALFFFFFPFFLALYIYTLLIYKPPLRVFGFIDLDGYLPSVYII